MPILMVGSNLRVETMATVTITFHFSDGSIEDNDFEGTSGVLDEVEDYAKNRADELYEEAVELACCDDEPDEITCDEWLISGTDTDHDDEESADDFDDLDEWGDYCDMVEEHGEAWVLRHADWSGHSDMDSYHGCYNSPEDYAQQFYDDCYGSDNSMYSYIDWERYARDVLMDYSVYEGSEGYHIFSDH